MQIVYTEEQEQLREVVSRFLQAKSTAVDVRRLMASSEGYDPAVWEQLCGEVGLAVRIFPKNMGALALARLSSVLFQRKWADTFTVDLSLPHRSWPGTPC